MPRNQVLVLAIMIAVFSGLGGYWIGASRSDDRVERRRAKRGDGNDEANEAKAKAKGDKKEKAKKKDEHVYTCSVCGETGKFRRFAGRKGSVCPKCKSKERHRLLMHYIANHPRLAHEKLDVLHFSPENAEKAFLRKLTNLHYVTADYLHEEELRLDLTALDLPDESWDVLIVYHILEHIVEDRKAMREMFRVLRPGGMAILQVPIDVDREEIYEDETIVDPKERRKAFGQGDHVRRYSASGLQARLEEAGFRVEPVDYIGQLGAEMVAKHRMSGGWKKPQDERIWVAHKAKPGDEVALDGGADGKAAGAEDGKVAAVADGKGGKASDGQAAGKGGKAEKAAGGKKAGGKADGEGGGSADAGADSTVK